MRVGNSASFIIDDELLEKFDFEGALVHPLEARLAMLVMSSKDDSFTLHIYKMELQNEQFQYEIEKLLTTKTFSTLTSMKYFLNTFSTFKQEDFIKFLQEYDK